jgi:hypothetical protein
MLSSSLLKRTIYRISWLKGVVHFQNKYVSRLTQSVNEGELPDDTNCEALANLCLAVLGGLHLRVLDGAPALLLFRSIDIFVNALGFTQGRRAPSARVRTPAKSQDEKGLNSPWKAK